MSRRRGNTEFDHFATFTSGFFAGFGCAEGFGWERDYDPVRADDEKPVVVATQHIPPTSITIPLRGILAYKDAK